jgi:hypothetical protein
VSDALSPVPFSNRRLKHLPHRPRRFRGQSFLAFCHRVKNLYAVFARTPRRMRGTL